MGTLLLVAGFCVVQPPAPSHTELIRRAVDNRQHVSTAHARLSLDESAAGPDGRAVPTRYLVEVWQTDKLYRQDMTKVGKHDPKNGVGVRDCICTLSDRDSMLASYEMGRSGVEVVKKADHRYSVYYNRGIDLRDVGGVADDVRAARYNAKSARSLLDMSKYDVVGPVVSDAVDGRNAYRLDRSLKKNGATQSLWFLPEAGGAVVRYRGQTAPGSKDKVTAEVVVDLFDKPVGGCWYPKRSVYTRSVNDKVSLTQTVTVDQIEVNVPIPESVFTLNALDILPGTPVIAPWLPDWLKDGKGAVYEWQNGKIGVRKNADLPYGVDPAVVAQANAPPDPVPADPPGFFGLYWRPGATVAFAVVASVCLVRLIGGRLRR